MLEIAGGILIAAFILIIFATIIEPWQSKVALRKVHKALEVIKNTPEAPLTPEEEEVIKKVQLVQFKCQYAENFIKDMESDAENDEIVNSSKEKLEDCIQSCLTMAQEIDSKYYNSAILHSISDLLSKSGQFQRANKIINLIKVDFMQSQAREFMNSMERKKKIAIV